MWGRACSSLFCLPSQACHKAELSKLGEGWGWTVAECHSFNQSNCHNQTHKLLSFSSLPSSLLTLNYLVFFLLSCHIFMPSFSFLSPPLMWPFILFLSPPMYLSLVCHSLSFHLFPFSLSSLFFLPFPTLPRKTCLITSVGSIKGLGMWSG